MTPDYALLSELHRLEALSQSAAERGAEMARERLTDVIESIRPQTRSLTLQPDEDNEIMEITVLVDADNRRLDATAELAGIDQDAFNELESLRAVLFTALRTLGWPGRRSWGAITIDIPPRHTIVVIDPS